MLPMWSERSAAYFVMFLHALIAISPKGHWIQDCPTNNDREYDNRPRIKRTTGIPRSFLKAVESPNTGPIGDGVMVTPEGGYVVAQPDVYVLLKTFYSVFLMFASGHRGKSKSSK